MGKRASSRGTTIPEPYHRPRLAAGRTQHSLVSFCCDTRFVARGRGPQTFILHHADLADSKDRAPGGLIRRKKSEFLRHFGLQSHPCERVDRRDEFGRPPCAEYLCGILEIVFSISPVARLRIRQSAGRLIVMFVPPSCHTHWPPTFPVDRADRTWHRPADHAARARVGVREVRWHGGAVSSSMRGRSASKPTRS